MRWHTSGWWTGADWVCLILLLIVIGLLIAILVRTPARAVWAAAAGRSAGTEDGASRGPASRSAQEILDERLAAGAIDVAEYDERRSRLNGRTSP